MAASSPRIVSTATSPWVEATCASLAARGSPMQSPMAYTPFTLVRIRSSMVMPSLFVAKPACSTPERFATRPAPSRTWSPSKVSGLPSISADTLTTAPVRRTSVTLAFTRTRRPRDSRARRRMRTRSASANAIGCGSISSTVTALPTSAKNVPSSSPTTPPPITMSRFGGSVSVSAEALSSGFASASPLIGGRPTFDPVATMIAFASIVWSPLAVRTRICVGEMSVPSPLTSSALRPLSRSSTPETFCFTTASLRATAFARSKRAPSTWTPCSSPWVAIQ